MLITPAYAQAAGAAPDPTTALIIQFAPLVLIFIIFYVLMIRPQQQAMKRHREKIAAVKKNDQVVTGGGLVGKVTRVEDDHVEVELAPGMKVRAIKSTLTDVTPIGGSKPAND